MKHKEKLIIIEGAQGTGKTTLCKNIKSLLGASNLYNLCGTSDTGSLGLYKSKQMYFALINYIKNLENCSINLIFDRIFITEQVYSKIGYKDYDFTTIYNSLIEKLYNLDFEIYLFLLIVQDIQILKQRFLNRDKKKDLSRKNIDDFDYNIEESLKQQYGYIELFNNLSLNTTKDKIHIKIINTDVMTFCNENIKYLLNIK